MSNQRVDIELKQFTAPYDSVKNGWRFPNGERIGEYKKAMSRAKKFDEFMIKQSKKAAD